MNAEALSRVPRTVGVWAKLNPVKLNRHLNKLLRNYLDETTKVLPISSLGFGKDAGYGHGKANVDYTPFASGIWTFGHVATQLSRRGINATQAQPTATIETLLDWWRADRDESAIKAHHITASFDPRISDEMHRMGYPIDAMLLSTVHDTLTQYASRFYPGEALGYVVGCHHDTANPHCHALVHPETTSGKLIRMSGNKTEECDQVDRFDFLRNTFNLRARQLFVSLRREFNPSVSVASRLGSWLLLCRKAMLDANPESVDAAFAASVQMVQARGKPELGKKLQDARQLLETECLIPPAGSPSPDRVRARWMEIHGNWVKGCDAQLASAMEAFRVVRDPSEEGSYTPTLSPRTLPKPATKTAYLALANRSLPTPTKDPWVAQQARRDQSARQRARVAIALKAYRSSLDRGRAELDALMAQSGFAVAQVHAAAASVFGVRPAFLTGLAETDDAQAARDLPSNARIESSAERAMLVSIEREAEQHRPAEAEATPGIFARAHVPRFRQLRVPVVISGDVHPTISL